MDKSNAVRTYDGIVCFGGEDWWYHHRGHYDMQMMREFSHRVPVLYVNSLGMRIPALKEGSVLLKRIAKKIASIRRGLVEERKGFWVFSPIVLPGRFGRAVSQRFLCLQIRRAVRKLGISKPLAWVACPPAVKILEDLKPVGVVYQRTDRFEEYPYVDHDLIAGFDSRLKSAADLTLYCSTLLYEEEKSECRKALFVDHGVDFEMFAKAGKGREDEPDDLRNLPRPRVGYIGNLESHRVNPDLILRVAERLSDHSFFLVGTTALPEGWCTLPNVSLLGPRHYEEVPRYMAAADVLIMPWQQNEWIRACNPVKLKEYLAVGRPVVTTPFDELRRYEGFAHTATDAESFAAAIRSAAERPDDPERLRSRVEKETWEAKARTVMERLGDLGFSSSAKRASD